MKIIIYGATGMVGSGALHVCLRADAVSEVAVVGRTSTGLQNAKLREILVADPADTDSYVDKLAGYDACFYCIGVASSGMSETDYTRLTYTLTLQIAEALARVAPQAVFVYVSGAGADSSEAGRTMWARVRGKTENALFKLPFRGVYALRPGIIEPLHGVVSKTRTYRLFYDIATPVLSILRKWFPQTVLRTDVMGEAMLALAKRGAAGAGVGPVLEAKQIWEASRR